MNFMRIVRQFKENCGENFLFNFIVIKIFGKILRKLYTNFEKILKVREIILNLLRNFSGILNYYSSNTNVFL